METLRGGPRKKGVDISFLPNGKKALPVTSSLTSLTACSAEMLSVRERERGTGRPDVAFLVPPANPPNGAEAAASGFQGPAG